MYCLVRSSENPLKTVKPNRSPVLHLLHSLFRVGPSLTTSIAFPRGQGLTFPRPLCRLPSTAQQSDPTPPRPEPQPSRVCRADPPCPPPPPLSTLPCLFHSSTMALASAPPCQASCPLRPKGYRFGLLPSKSAQVFSGALSVTRTPNPPSPPGTCCHLAHCPLYLPCLQSISPHRNLSSRGLAGALGTQLTAVSPAPSTGPSTEWAFSSYSSNRLCKVLS